jgi:hypothetical protein
LCSQIAGQNLEREIISLGAQFCLKQDGPVLVQGDSGFAVDSGRSRMSIAIAIVCVGCRCPVTRVQSRGRPVTSPRGGKLSQYHTAVVCKKCFVL